MAEREESRKVVMWEAMVVRNVKMSPAAPGDMEEDKGEDEGSDGGGGDSWDKSHETRSRSCGVYR